MSAAAFSRTAKVLVEEGGYQGSLEDALDRLARWRIHIVLGLDGVSLGHHAALLTAVENAHRATGNVSVALPASLIDVTCLVPGLRPGVVTLSEAVRDAGGRLLADVGPDSGLPVIVIGEHPDAAPANEVSLQVTWDGWVACVDPDGIRLTERGNMTLAPVAAAALAVLEAFLYLLGRPDTGLRSRTLSLWDPAGATVMHADGRPAASDLDNGPQLERLPAGAMFIGLGHLGQAYAWCWRMLPYPDPGTCLLVLQDAERIDPANASTGMFVTATDEGNYKTRVVSAALERSGFATRMIERPLFEGQRVEVGEPMLALVGVDKTTPRRLISTVGWSLAVDVGLGSGAVDFTSISLHTFPAAGDSREVTAWAREPRDRSEQAAARGAYRDAVAAGADPCGIVQLAGRAAAASFVGVVAACLAVAEPLRLLHGGPTSRVLALDGARGGLRRQVSQLNERVAYLDLQ